MKLAQIFRQVRLGFYYFLRSFCLEVKTDFDKNACDVGILSSS